MEEPFVTGRMADLLSWRDTLDGQVHGVFATLDRNQLLEPADEQRLRDLSSRIQGDRLTIAFVSEAERGKSELINALFFSERRRRLLPSGPGRATLCVTELRYDRSQPPCLRLLPIETRESPTAYKDLFADPNLWKTVPFNYEDFDSISRALGSLSESRRVTLGEAVAWGLHRDALAKAPAGNDSLVDVPRWRHAIINMPHPVLQAGLVVIDTPGLATLAAEPELSHQRIPACDCVVFILDATQGMTRVDMAIWREYLGGKVMPGQAGRPPEQPVNNRLVVLNKIDMLQPEDSPPSPEVLRTIDKLVKDAADLLRVDPIKVVPISARLGFAGKTTGDRDKLVKSRLYQIERAITRELGHGRQESLSAETREVLGDLLARGRARLDEERYEMLGRLRELGELRERNQRLLGSLVNQATSHLNRYESAMTELRVLRSAHNRLGEELAALIDRERARKHAQDTATMLSAAILPGAVQELVDAYMAESRYRIVQSDARIADIKQVYGDAIRKFSKDFGLSGEEMLPFSTQRFLAELQKAEAQCAEDFTASVATLIKRGTGLGDHFTETVGNRVAYLFDIAARESTLWMRGLQAGIDKTFEKIKDVALQRAQGTEKLKMADIDLAEMISELQARLDVIKARHTALGDSAALLERHFGQPRPDEDVASEA